MNLTRDQLAELVNDHVQGYRHCTGSLDLADIIIKADRETHRERFDGPALRIIMCRTDETVGGDDEGNGLCACGNGPADDYFCCAVGDGCASWCHDDEKPQR